MSNKRSIWYGAGGGMVSIVDRQSYERYYRGRVLMHSVVYASALPDDEDGIALLDRMESSRSGSSGLVRIRCDGSVAWEAPCETQSGKDCYVRFCITHKGLMAWTWRCRLMEVDVESGSVLRAIRTG